MRDAWLPLFAKHQVDLVINGHNHVYERTDAIKGGKVGRRVPVGASTDPTRDGIVYVTAGGAGKSLYGFPDGVKDSYEGKIADRESVETFHWTKSRDQNRRHRGVVAGAVHRLLLPLRGGGGGTRPRGSRCRRWRRAASASTTSRCGAGREAPRRTSCGCGSRLRR